MSRAGLPVVSLCGEAVCQTHKGAFRQVAIATALAADGHLTRAWSIPLEAKIEMSVMEV
jgi:hypothetical protein